MLGLLNDEILLGVESASKADAGRTLIDRDESFVTSHRKHNRLHVSVLNQGKDETGGTRNVLLILRERHRRIASKHALIRFE